MEETKPHEKAQEKKVNTSKRKTFLKKLDPETAKTLLALKEKANKKNFGRKIRDTEIIAKALTLIEPTHLEELQEATLSEKDRLLMAHEEFVKQNGKISLDQFIGKLLKGEISVTNH
ncbi:MAG: hypothetical protein LW875_03900 [Proteobacteria bacterium]|jgi:hypothetical protein|nr:hypothetical protein [Pseudomonadota bacterium]